MEIKLRGNFFFRKGRQEDDSKRQQIGVSNGAIQFKSARKISPLLELLAKITRVLACSCSQNFCSNFP